MQFETMEGGLPTKQLEIQVLTNGHKIRGTKLSTAFRNYRDIRQEPQRHKDTKKGRIKESFYCGLSLCLCVFVVLAYVTVFANNCNLTFNKPSYRCCRR